MLSWSYEILDLIVLYIKYNKFNNLINMHITRDGIEFLKLIRFLLKGYDPIFAKLSRLDIEGLHIWAQHFGAIMYPEFAKTLYLTIITTHREKSLTCISLFDEVSPTDLLSAGSSFRASFGSPSPSPGKKFDLEFDLVVDYCHFSNKRKKRNMANNPTPSQLPNLPPYIGYSHDTKVLYKYWDEMKAYLHESTSCNLCDSISQCTCKIGIYLTTKSWTSCNLCGHSCKIGIHLNIS
jgi:hypothetical protein